MNQADLNKESIKLLAKIYKWRKKLIIVTVAAAVLSIIASFIISPQYKATAIVFPSRTFSVAKLLVEQNAGNQEDYMELGDEDDAEKFLQILNSTEIREMAAKEYDLYTHWKIPRDNELTAHYLNLKWNEMVSFKRTDYVSIRIDVYDYESDRAAKIANSIVAYADSVKNRMTREVAKQAFAIVEEEYNNYLASVKEMEDSVQVIRELGVLDYKSEMKAYSKEMAKAVANGDDRAQSKLKGKLDTLQKYGMAFVDLTEKLKKYRFKYPVIKGKYDEAFVNLNRHLPSKFVVDKAQRNEKKAKPVRALIVIVSTLSAFMLALLFLLFADKLVEIKNQVVSQSKDENL
jgi:LPS O-antigen subunit length determinant protein (WzzB/FepE family)